MEVFSKDIFLWQFVVKSKLRYFWKVKNNFKKLINSCVFARMTYILEWKEYNINKTKNILVFDEIEKNITTILIYFLSTKQ